MEITKVYIDEKKKVVISYETNNGVEHTIKGNKPHPDFLSSLKEVQPLFELIMELPNLTLRGIEWKRHTDYIAYDLIGTISSQNRSQYKEFKIKATNLVAEDDYQDYFEDYENEPTLFSYVYEEFLDNVEEEALNYINGKREPDPQLELDLANARAFEKMIMGEGESE